MRLLSTSYDPVTLAPGIDGPTFTAGAAGIVAIAFSLAPIVRAVRIDPARCWKAGAAPGGDRRPAGIARALVAAQVLSMVLVGSALFVRNLTQLLTKDAGFNRDGLLVVNVDVLSPVSAHASAGDRAPNLTVWAWRVVATPARDAWGVLGEPVAEAADQQRAGILVRDLQRRRATGQ